MKPNRIELLAGQAYRTDEWLRGDRLPRVLAGRIWLSGPRLGDRVVSAGEPWPALAGPERAQVLATVLGERATVSLDPAEPRGTTGKA